MEKLYTTVIVLPTYNERENIVDTLQLISSQTDKLQDVRLKIVVVDDLSPDGTGDRVREYMKTAPHVYLITGKKQGLGNAYKRGFTYAMNELNADIVFQMDSDGQHDPNDIPRLILGIKSGYDVVIGSRYTKGGSIPDHWSLKRKLNSSIGNLLARNISQLGEIHDCTGGFRAIRTEVLSKISLEKIKAEGYSFQISLLHALLQKKASVIEIPISFGQRTYGVSKISSRDVYEFICNAVELRFPQVKATIVCTLLLFLLLASLVMVVQLRHLYHYSITSVLILVLIGTSIMMSLQGMFTIFLMVYAWEDIERVQRDSPSKVYMHPRYSFTALIPARHEAEVIGETIETIAKMHYPEDLKEVIVLCRSDDNETIHAAKESISVLQQHNIKLVIFNDYPINKPHALNIGLDHTTKDVVVVFDAEDQPHAQLYNIINTVMESKHSDIVQSGVQLMNFRTHWFSTLNVLEYYFWFKSILHFFAKAKSMPLGGNSVFMKKYWLKKVDGWDEDCLTEDAEIGIRMSSIGAKVDVVYEEEYATQEETPDSLKSFIKQRTRWNQGFIQILMKGSWLHLQKPSQKLLAWYILVVPFMQPLLFFLIPLSIYIAATVKLSVLFTLILMIPLQLLLLQIVIYTVGLFEFTKAYRMKFPLTTPLKILLTFYPFQIILAISAIRSIYRIIFRKHSWEKTKHVNAHRETFTIPNLLATYTL